MLIVLFGPPGAGKNYIGRMLEQHGFHFYDADVDFTDEQREAIRQDVPFTDEMRVEFFRRVHERVRELMRREQKVAVANVFLKQKYRDEFVQNFPEACLVLIDTSREERTRRIYARGEHHVPPELAIRMGDTFEVESTPAFVIKNENGQPDLPAQLERLFERLSP